MPRHERVLVSGGDVSKTPAVPGSSNAQAVSIASIGAGVVLPIGPVKSNNTAITNVPQNAGSVVLAAANPARLGLTITNDPTSTKTLFVRAAIGPATLANYSVPLLPGDSAPIVDYDGDVSGIWGGAGAGFAMVTEFLP